MKGLLPYIGGKHRIAPRIVERLQTTGADTLVDVFGGSAAVTLAASDAGFKKIIYNDLDGDLVNFFRVLSDPAMRVRLFRSLRDLPASRKIFEDDYAIYRAGGFSFHNVASPVDRARCTFYRHLFSFGGKTRSGGFAISTGDRQGIKELVRYRNTLRRLSAAGAFFRGVGLENLHFSDAIALYGNRPNVVLFADPPYDGTEDCYARKFSTADHIFLANQLATCKASVVLTYYDTPLIRDCYPESDWDWHPVSATKNCQFIYGNKIKTTEQIIVRRARATAAPATPEFALEAAR